MAIFPLPETEKTTISITAERRDEIVQEVKNSIIVRKSEIIDLWERGILTPLAFVHMALQIDGLDKPLDVDNFIYRWSGTPDPSTGKVKRLTRKQLLVAIATLEDREILEFTATQLTLNFV